MSFLKNILFFGVCLLFAACYNGGGDTDPKSHVAAITIALGDVGEADLGLPPQTETVAANTESSFTVNGSYTSYQWYIDGEPVGTEQTYTFNQSAGVYELSVVVNASGGRQSGRCQITAH